jgi:tetratricopeptide (TPR) repeat protein
MQTSAAVAVFFVITLVFGTASGRPEPTSQAPGKESEAAIKKGDDLFKAGKYQDAIQAYKDALDRDPNNDHVMEYTVLSYNRMGDREQARSWMKRRLDIPGQTPSIKARVLTDLALLYWDEARADFLRSSGGGEKAKAEDVAKIQKLVADGTDSAQKAVAIAPKSAKAFNLLNLLNRVQAELEQDGSKQKDSIARADEALRHSIAFYEASVQQQQAHDMFGVPTVSVPAGQSADGLKLGQAKKLGLGNVRGTGGSTVAVEVLVGVDGKVLYPRVVSAPAKTGDAAIAAAKQWEFEPSTFEGHVVQVIEMISFPVK